MISPEPHTADAFCGRHGPLSGTARRPSPLRKKLPRCTVAAEMAAELGMSVGAVFVAKSRVLKRLREEFGDLLE